MKMPSKLQRLINKFTRKNIQNGDLVITAEVHRVTNAKWGQGRYRGDIEVENVWPERGGKHIMSTRRGGQHGVFKLKHL